MPRDGRRPGCCEQNKSTGGAGAPVAEALEGRLLLSSLGFVGQTIGTDLDQPAAIVAADFDGDGVLDLAVANASAGDVTILRGRGDGGFTIQPTRPVGSAPRSIAAGDLNGDGRTDLVVGNAMGNSLTVLLNDGSGGFLPGFDVALPAGPRSVAVGDLTGDGAADIAVALFSTNEVAVLRNLGGWGGGGGGFAPPVTFAVGAGPVGLLMADLDGDGDRDLATTNITAGTVSVLRNNGAGAFPVIRTYAVGALPRGIAAADLTGDGRVDLVVANSFSGTVSVLPGSGSVGEPAFDPHLQFGAGNQPNGVIIADLDGDGVLDVATANLVSGDVTVLRGLGGGALASAQAFAAGAGAIALAAGDFDGDGDTDLAVANSLAHSLTVLRAVSGSGTQPPVVGGLTASPDPLIAGGVLTLTATGVFDPDDFVTSVRFYRDTNNNGVRDSGDQLIFEDTDGSDGWAWTGPSGAQWAPGVNRFFAVAVDGFGLQSDAAAALAFVRRRPQIASLSAGAAVIQPGATFTLAATGVADVDGSVQRVRFYRDSNGNGVLDDADQLLGEDVSGSDGWTWTGTANAAWGPGQVRYFARATDNDGLESVAAAAAVLQTALPTIASASASPNPVFFGQAVTLTATGVSDADGSVTSVQFWADLNGNGAVDGADLLLGTDTDGANGWSLATVYPAAPGPTGTLRFLARAVDNLGAAGPATAFSAALRYRPTIAGLEASDETVASGGTLTLTAAGVADFDGSVASVAFYRDTNNNGVLDGADQLLGTDSSGADGWSWTVAVPASGWGPAVNRFFARATDNQGNPGAAANVTVLINDPPVVEEFIAYPGEVGYGEALILEAVALDADGVVQYVNFYWDADGDGAVGDGDEFLGWGLAVEGALYRLETTVDPWWGVGEARFLAIAVDDFGTEGAPLGAAVFVFARPIVGALFADPDPVPVGAPFTLSALGVDYEGGEVVEVWFYWDADGDGELSDGDELLGTDSDGSDGWSWATAADPQWGTGFIGFFAVAWGNDESRGPAASTLVGISTPPTIGSLNISPDPVRWGETLKLTAQQVSDTEGAVAGVLFYRDINGNGMLDDFERFIPTFGKESQAGIWAAIVQAGPAWGVGVVRFFAVAIDDVGLGSDPVTATVEVIGVPVLTGLLFGPQEAFLGGTLTLAAQRPQGAAGSAVQSVRFFRDSNNNGVLDEADQELGPPDTTPGDGLQWTGMADPAWGAGPARFFALPVGGDGEIGEAVAAEFNLWTRLYFPEGWRNDTTVNEYVPVANPNAYDVFYRVIARYETGERDQVIFEGVIPALSRGGITTTERARPEEALTRLNTGYALEIQASGPLGAVLSRYDNFSPSGQGFADVANGEAFTDRTSTVWAFADVVRAPGAVFDFILYYNPTEEDGLVTITLYYEDGGRIDFAFAAPALRRGGVNFNAETFIPEGRFAAVLNSSVPIVAAQSRYEASTGHGFTTLGDPSAGTLAATVTFLDVDMSDANTATVFNPSDSVTATVTLAVRRPASEADSVEDAPTTFELAPGASRRLTATQFGLGARRSAAVQITATSPVVVQGVGIDALRGDGTATGVAAPSTGWVFADAFLDRNTAGIVGFEYLALFNPGVEPLPVEILLYGAPGETPGRVVVEVEPGETWMVDLHGAGVPLPGTGNLVFYAVGAFAPAPFRAFFTHWDLFQNGGWSTTGTPVGPVGGLE